MRGYRGAGYVQAHAALERAVAGFIREGLGEGERLTRLSPSGILTTPVQQSTTLRDHTSDGHSGWSPDRSFCPILSFANNEDHTLISKCPIAADTVP